MAYTVSELKTVQIESAGTGARIKLIGQSVNNGASDTSFVITPGHNDVNIASPIASTSLRHMGRWKFSNRSAQKEPKVVKSFDATNNCDILTITCAADDDYDWWIEGEAV